MSNQNATWFASQHNLKIPGSERSAVVQTALAGRLFFRGSNRTCAFKHFFGNSGNAVPRKFWIAVTVYVMIAILHKGLQLPGTLHRTLQILSVHPFLKKRLSMNYFTELAPNPLHDDKF